MQTRRQGDRETRRSSESARGNEHIPHSRTRDRQECLPHLNPLPALPRSTGGGKMRGQPITEASMNFLRLVIGLGIVALLGGCHQQKPEVAKRPPVYGNVIRDSTAARADTE